MPNIAAKFRKSITALTGDEEYRQKAMELGSLFGKSVWVANEDELNVATALAGSAPAFLALAAEAMIDGAVRAGLKRHDAQEMARGLFDGFNALFQQESATAIKEGVMSPKGTTAAGVYALEKAGARAAFMDAVQAAYDKASH